ncbi:hypothetical protein MHUMG1_07603 [Metarhizium humberi]|uniref:Uncharacterized protein n=1 Tax=Metarhizium humberi TaxID=2596975 RepID=A0A9P8S601_9HYPO|nr:hypothetical protein MHUMG1_07603 [Metarhizium humberi]
MSASALDKVQKETRAQFGHDRPFPLAACASSVLGQRRRAIHRRHWPPCPRDAGLPRTESQLASALEPASSDLPRTATMARWHVIVESGRQPSALRPRRRRGASMSSYLTPSAMSRPLRLWLVTGLA